MTNLRSLSDLFVATRRLAAACAFTTAIAAAAFAQTNTFPSSGNVGVGTTSPGVLLEVNKSQNAQTSVHVINGSNDTAASSLVLFGEQASDGHYSYVGHFSRSFNPGGASFAEPGSFAMFGGSDGNVNVATNNNKRFQVWTTPDNGANWAVRFAVGGTGNVGIGTLNPAFDANVTKYLALDGGSYFGSIGVGGNITSTPHPVGQYAFFNSGLSGSEKRVATIVGATDVAMNSGKIDFWTTSAGSFGSGPKMTIFSNGNVGINTTNPAAYKLDVNGEINATGFRINGTPISSGSSQWTGSSSIYYNGGNVGIGIGTTTPGAKLDLGVGSAARGSYSDLLVGTGGNNAQIEFYGPTKSSALTHDEALGGLVLYTNGPTWTPSMFIGNGGNVGIGTSSPSGYKLDVNGNTNVTGNLNVTGTVNAKYQDLAEWVPSSEQLFAGTVVVLDTTKSNQVVASTHAYDTRVAGVISAQPGITLGESGEGKVLVATTGRVRVKVDASRGAIQIGDLLVTSDVPGVAMKSEVVNLGGVQIHRPGTIIGKALEPLAKGSGEILVLLSLQ